MRKSTGRAWLSLAASALLSSIWLPAFSQQVINLTPPSFIPPALKNVDPSVVELEEQPQVAPGLSTPQPFSTDVTRVFKTASPEPIVGSVLRTNPGVFVFSNSNCAGLVSQDHELMFYALRGSLYSVEGPHQIKLVRGRLLSIAGGEKGELSVNDNKIVTLPHCATIVETGPQGLLRVHALTAPAEKEVAAAVFLKDSPQAIKLLPGQELVVAAHDLAAGDLDTADGIARNPIENVLPQALASRARMFAFSLAQLADFDAIFACPKLANKPLSYRLQGLQTVFEKLLDESVKQKDFAPTVANNDMKSAFEEANDKMMSIVNVSHVTPSIDYKTVVAIKGEQIYAAANASCELKDPAHLNLSSGVIVVSSKKPLTITVAGKEISIRRNAVALVKYQDNVLKVTNLKDLRQNSLQVIEGQQTVPVSLGDELIVSDQAPSLSDIFDISKVGHRTTSTKQVNGFGWLTSSEIAINDLVANQPLLASLQKNATGKPEAKMLAQVIKTAATVNTVRKNAGPFLYGEPDDENGTTKRVAARCNQCMN